MQSLERRGRRAVVAALAMCTLCGSVTTLASAQDSVTVIAGSQYDAGWLTRFTLGSDYRDLWNTPIAVPLLDLTSFAGGLTPFRTGGFGQTSTLHFRNPEGLRYVFRSVDKDPSRRLAEELRGTFVEDVLQDQVSALFPGAALVVAPLLNAAGVLSPQPRLFVMPDTHVLGEFREQFVGRLGLLMENPDEGPDDPQGDPLPGFAGSRRVSDTERVFDDTENSPRDRIAVLDYLKARLLDVFVGDRDRHPGQWRWARFPADADRIWVPVPEDRDQAFISQDGLLMWMVRTFLTRKYVTFGRDYPPIEKVTWNAWDVDRRFLAGVERPVWDSIATDLQNRLTDSVIRDAVRQLPEPYYAARGPWLIDVLQSRRDALPDMARSFYRMLAEAVTVHATDVSELAQIESRDGRFVAVAIAARDGATVRAPHYTRTFDAQETEEIRIDLHGGADRAVVWGGEVPIRIRVIGGGGADTLIDSATTRVHFYDTGDRSHFVRGAGTSVDRRDFEPPPSSDPAHEQPPDWGHWLRIFPAIGARPDVGILLGARIEDERYGFRRFPFSSRLSFQTLLATGAVLPSVEGRAEWNDVRPRLDLRMSGRFTGLDLIHFFGFGNETPNTEDDDFFRIRQLEAGLEASLAYAPSARWRIDLGLEVQRSSTLEDAGTLLGSTQPYGFGTFHQIGLRTGVEVDLTDRPIASRHGVRLGVSSFLVPGVFDVRTTFWRIVAEAAGYLTFGPTLAIRVRGAKTVGEVPFHEAVYLGGYGSLRGFNEQRFAGDAALVANAEVRLPITWFNLMVPMHVGVLGFGDLGRVFLSGERSDRWHRGAGGGVWLSVLDPSSTLTISVAHGERTDVYVTAGFMF